MPVRVSQPSSSGMEARPQSVFMEFLLEIGGLNGLTIFRIMGALPERNLKITLETIFNSGLTTPGDRAIQL